mmetsp:Transcript_15065/g.30088  ORF Transcript_15065/g.30088 Transcript_15065/m.30088 type:complete len:126 (-) Transcript_15065:827-1204(-)
MGRAGEDCVGLMFLMLVLQVVDDRDRFLILDAGVTPSAVELGLADATDTSRSPAAPAPPALCGGRSAAFAAGTDLCGRACSIRTAFMRSLLVLSFGGGASTTWVGIGSMDWDLLLLLPILERGLR